ncbi:transposase [Nostoc sp. PCC 7524]|uniref:IS200/IS605 family transposase n=1 Tax=Nostoc sp. (strain ATCC 29411 / PCC 7524) TaxID=28072 RepID=UPI00029F2E51|nr:IS200/IS605 family transposase [Nostoc sp. PCC 7524]AFY48526.1 transposase [Nostoc sp. PCC 7524]
MAYKSTARSISDLKAHLVLTTKYRKKVITPAMLIRLGESVNHISQKWGCEVVEFNGESDPSGSQSLQAGKPVQRAAHHVHLLFRYYPQMQLSKFVNALKSYTSQQIRKEFLMEIRRVYWGKPVFWNSAYFIASCGGVTVEVLKQYVQNQDSSTCAQDQLAIPHPPHSPRQPSG